MTHQTIAQDFKCLIAAFLDNMIAAARANPQLDAALLGRTITAETLLLAARLHEGNDASFINMARRALALARTGAIEQ